MQAERNVAGYRLRRVACDVIAAGLNRLVTAPVRNPCFLYNGNWPREYTERHGIVADHAGVVRVVAWQLFRGLRLDSVAFNQQVT